MFLKEKKIVVTAGGTRENIDPVRFIGNYSSGKMGKAIADKAFESGAQVVLITTSHDQNTPYKSIKVSSASEMLHAVKEEFQDNNADILFMTAAVADYRPEIISENKIKKDNNEELIVKLVKNPDILSEMCKTKKMHQQVIGFCAESENLIEYAKTKIQKKNCDFIAANDISRKDIGFSGDFNEVFLIDKKLNITKIEKNTKENVATQLLELLYGENN